MIKQWENLMRTLTIFIILIVIGCGAKPPCAVRYIEGLELVEIDGAYPVDPNSLLITVRQDGRVFHKGNHITQDEIKAIVAVANKGTVGSKNIIPILLETSKSSQFSILHSTLESLYSAHCFNVAFLVRSSAEHKALTIPVSAEGGFERYVYDGPSRTLLYKGSVISISPIEVTVRPGIDGVIRVENIDQSRHLVEDPVYRDGGPSKVEPTSWKGARPPYGVWTATALVEYLKRDDLVQRTPYVTLDIRPSDSIANVIKCLAAIKTVAKGRLDVEIYREDK